MKLMINNKLKYIFSSLTLRMVCLILFTLYFALYAFVSSAAPYTPGADEVVSEWPSKAVAEQAIGGVQNVSWHLEQSRYAGMGNYHFSQARILFDKLQKSAVNPAEYHYLAARLLQHQHKFIAALEHLDITLAAEATHVSAWLLKANILLIQNEMNSAMNACKKLVGNTSLLVATACSLEVSSYQPEKLQESYTLLSLLLNRSGFERSQASSASQQEQYLWLVQLAADMALRLERFDEADRWLSVINLQEMPLSYIVLWADVQLKRGEYDLVLGTLATIVEQKPFKNDALLVRLAMAQSASTESRAESSASQNWQALAKQRIEIRIKRNDGFHAADIARFFLYVEPDPQTALYWAEQNYAQAKLFDDRALLEAAKLAMQAQGI